MFMKKFAALASACAMIGALTACGGTQSQSQTEAKKEAETVAETTAAETTAAETTAAESSQKAKKVGDFPNKTMTIIVPLSAGGTTDIGARLLAEHLSDYLGVNIVVENQPGAGCWMAWSGFIPNEDYKDGYTMCLFNHNFPIGELDPDNPREYNMDDIQPLVNQVLDYNVMAIRPDETRFHDLQSFIDYAKENPVLIGSQAVGITDGDSTTGEWFNKTFGTQITTVPLNGGAEARTMFLAGDTDVYFASVSEVAPDAAEGVMEPVCVFYDERSSFLPEVPTIKEVLGVDYSTFAARFYAYPQGVDKEIVDFMTESIQTVMASEAYLKDMAELSMNLDTTSGEDLRELISSIGTLRKEIWE